MEKSRFVPNDPESGSSLPIRKDFWKDIIPKIKQGIIVLEGSQQNESRWRDIYYATMPEIITAIYSEAIENFKRPTLEKSGHGFPLDFIREYHEQMNKSVETIRERIETELLDNLKESPEKDLTPLEAALLSQTFNDNRTLIPDSGPFFIHIGIYGYIYEQLLKEKMGTAYSADALYETLEKNFSNVLLAQTATSNLLTEAERALLYGQDYWEKATEGGVPFTLKTLNYSHLHLDKNDVLRVTPEGVATIHEFIKEKKPTESLSGRTEERGCPVLYTKNLKDIYDFGVREYIAQHKIAHQQTEL